MSPARLDLEDVERCFGASARSDQESQALGCKAACDPGKTRRSNSPANRGHDPLREPGS